MKGLIKKIFFWIAMREDRKKLYDYDFSFVSNNCFGGILYKQLRKPYLSPFVGLFITGKDFLSLISRFDYYINCDLIFKDKSKNDYVNNLKKENSSIPIGSLDDIELIFLHYSTKEEALEKWERRKLRMNFENIIFNHSTAFFSNEKIIADFFLELDNRKGFAIGTIDSNFEINVPNSDSIRELYWPMFNYKMYELLKNGKKIKKPLYIRILGTIALKLLR